MKDLNLLDVLTEEEIAELDSDQKKKVDNAAHLDAQRKAKLESVGLYDSCTQTTEWVPQERVTFWRRWACTCGKHYEGPAYDTNPTWVRYEKMRTQTFSVHRREWVPLKEPKPLKSRPSVYRRGHVVGIPHTIEYLETQLWSCPSCLHHASVKGELARPWTGRPQDACESLDDLIDEANVNSH